jgi:hypothetical protein
MPTPEYYWQVSSSHVNAFGGTLYTEYLRIINVPLLLDQMCPAAWKLSSQMSDESKISSSLAVIIDCSLSLSLSRFLLYQFVPSKVCVSSPCAFPSYNLACLLSESSVTTLCVQSLSPLLILLLDKFRNGMSTIYVLPNLVLVWIHLRCG